MSDPKCISPLLDGFTIGKLMSNHDGVRCYPAIKENSDTRYIVKIVSIPASQVQLDALLLTGAYHDPASAMDYFKELADGVVKEAHTLRKLSKLEGYLPYEGWQVAPMDNNQLGYEIYLLSSYKRTLDKHIRRNAMTHLGAINLGLDICAALAIARRSGKMYVDLKPSNIFISEKREYRIGDLGFMDLDNLQYTSMPNKYRSRYTPPELNDPMVTLNTTVDTYTLGAILYEIYNNGTLAEPDEETGVYPSPVNADYELAEIILKAMAPDPKDRWSEPYDMGQALVAYMQRNSVNDTPVSALTAPIIADGPIEIPAEEKQDILPSEDSSITGQPATAEEAIAEAIDPSEQMVTIPPLEPTEYAEEGSLISAIVDDSAENPAPNISLTQDIFPDQAADSDFPSAPQFTLNTNFSFASDFGDEDVSPLAYLNGDTNDSGDPITEMKTLLDHDSDEADMGSDVHIRSHGKRSLLIPIVSVLVLSLLLTCGYYFYKNFYVKTIDGLEVEGERDRMSVMVETDVDESLLTVVCTDTYGNKLKEPVSNGKAVFTGLLPDTQYKIEVEISGFHKLKGSTSHSFNTDAQTVVSDFQVVTGSEDGTAVLTFTVTGPETNEWIITCTPEGEEAITIPVTGHMLTIPGLTVGKRYSFDLKPATELYMIGETSVEFVASKIIIAENLDAVSCIDGNLTAQWNAPADTSVESWTVRCYTDDGYDKSIVCTEPTAVFSEIDSKKEYTIEVTAAGMTQPAWITVSADPVHVKDIVVDESEPTSLKLSWQFEGTAPANGWLIMYRIDGSDMPEVVQCEGPSGVVKPRIPGANYVFSIQAADGRTAFGGKLNYTCPNAPIFVSAENAFTEEKTQKIQANMLVTPFKNWSYQDITPGYYTSNFKVGQGISVLLYSPINFYVNYGDVSILYVIRNSEGKVLTDLIGQETRDWRAMWVNIDYHYCELDLPHIPAEPGEYTLYLYFNNGAVTTLNFTIAE